MVKGKIEVTQNVLNLNSYYLCGEHLPKTQYKLKRFLNEFYGEDDKSSHKTSKNNFEVT